MTQTLFRDTAREEYFYQLGRQQAFTEAGAKTVADQLSVVVKHALEQVNGA